MDSTMPVAESTITGYAISKGALGLGGLLGALAMASMFVPKKLQERFPRTSVAVASGLGIFLSLSAGSIAIIAMGWDAKSPEINFAVGSLSGAFAAVFFVWFANTVKKTEESDVFEVATMVKKKRVPAKRAPAKKVAVKRVKPEIAK